MSQAVLTDDEMKKKKPLKHLHTFIAAVGFCPPFPAASAKVQLFCKTLKESPRFLQN